MIWQTDQYSSFLYRGGFVLLSLATVMVLMPLAHPACRLGVVARLEAAALDRRALLRHLPLARADHRPHHPRRRRHGAEPAARAAAGGGDLRRRGALLEVTSRSRSATARSAASSPGAARAAGAGRRSRREGWAAIVGAAVVLVAAVAGMAGVNSAPPKAKTRGSRKRARPAPTKPAPLTPAQAADSTRSSCKAVVHIGDSTSEGLDSPEYLPTRKPADRSPVRRSRRRRTAHGDLRRALDRRAVRRRTERPGSRRSLEGRRLQRLLGAGARDQRGGQRRRRLDRRRARTDRKNDGRSSATNR